MSGVDDPARCNLCYRPISHTAYVTIVARMPRTRLKRDHHLEWEVFRSWTACADCTEILHTYTRDEVLMHTSHVRAGAQSSLPVFEAFRYQFVHYAVPVGNLHELNALDVAVK